VELGGQAAPVEQLLATQFPATHTAPTGQLLPFEQLPFTGSHAPFKQTVLVGQLGHPVVVLIESSPERPQPKSETATKTRPSRSVSCIVRPQLLQRCRTLDRLFRECQ
jgi:hypothetical protein